MKKKNRRQTRGHCCDAMTLYLHEDSLPLAYVPKFREYGLRVLDGGTSYIVLTFCPWCGARLPSSMREAWFDAVEKLGLEPESPALPLPYRSDLWWRNREKSG